MPRPLRVLPARMTFHVFNRAIENHLLFQRPADYRAFDAALVHAVRTHRVRLYAHAVMPNHWHLQCAGLAPGALSRFVQWLTQTHARRWRHFHGRGSRGHVYQSRFQAVPVEPGEHFLVLAAYIARNPVRAGLVSRAEHWAWSSHGRVAQGLGGSARVLSEWPTPAPTNWDDVVAAPVAADRVRAIRESIARGLPFGSDDWSEATARRLGLKRRLDRARRRRVVDAA